LHSKAADVGIVASVTTLCGVIDFEQFGQQELDRALF
jgi:hypothetical protein